MIYHGVIVPFSPELSRVSYDPTPLLCENCGEAVMQPLVVPGEQIGRPGHTYKVVRCLNCIFFSTYYVYFEGDMPVRVAFNPDDAENAHFLRDRKDDSWPNLASLQWRPGTPEPGLRYAYSVAGGDPDWLQEEVEVDCPSCGRPMEFVLQFASDSIDPNRHAPQLKSEFYLKIEYYATLFLFQCTTCNITASVTQCS